MTTAVIIPMRKTARVGRRIGLVPLRRNADAFTAGDAPTAFRILAAGENATDKGPLVFTPDSAKMVADAFAARGNPLAIYYEHEDQLPLEKRGGSPMRGVCAAPSSTLAIRNSATGPECWAEGVAWTEEAQRQIKTGERRQISPVAAFDKDTREVVEILNVSLCSEGATHFGTLLASKGGLRPMDDIIDKIMEALESGDFETAENLVQEAEAAGSADMAKMGRFAIKCAKMAKGAAPPPPPPAADPAAAATKLAAARVQMVAAGASVVALDRAAAEFTGAAREARDAAKESRRETVSLKLSRALEEGLLGPEGDPVTEREYLAAADPAATDRFIAHLRRQAKVGILTLAKPGATVTAPEARDGQKKPDAAVENFGLTETEVASAKQNGVTLEAFAASKARINTRTTIEPGKA